MKDHHYSDIWILAEQQKGRIQDISFELLTRGQELKEQRGCMLNAMVFGGEISEGELQRLIDCGADSVVFIRADELDIFRIEPHAQCLLELIEEYRPEVILAGATFTGRTLMPYVAVKAHTGLTADCTHLEYEKGTGNLLQTRPAIGGNIMATIRTPDHRPQMVTVRPKSAPRMEPAKGRIGEITIKAPPGNLKSRVERIRIIPADEELSLQEAEKVVVVGRGIRKAGNIPLIRAFADEIGAALGASREVVDRGWLSYPHQVGLSGKTIIPKLYIGVGVSGAIQHLAGMQTAENIIAVNSDSEAQIFKVADLGIVGNLFEVIPDLTLKLKQMKTGSAKAGGK